tara:strand:- start:15775 stop:17229 length:1455 start_codon:yes stop_codon:yes gene_type:complete
MTMKLPVYLSSGEQARLIPVAADGNKETRATAIILATMSAVPAYRKEMLGYLGKRVGIRSGLQCFTEITFKETKEKSRPDGLLLLDNGRGKVWSCLIEAKIKNQNLDQEQIEKYILLAKQHNIDAMLTISNQFVAIPTHSPFKLSKVSTRGVEIYHWSWMHALTTAMLLISEDEFESFEQKFILSEMIRYFSHQSTGVSTFDRMNSEWKDIVTKIQSGAILNKSDIAVENTVGAWHQETRDICLLLSRKLNRAVKLKLNKAHTDDPITRVKDDAEALIKDYKLTSAFDIPNTASSMLVTADLLRRSVSLSMTLIAPKDKQKTSSKINWLLKQLSKSDPSNIYIKATWPSRCPDTLAQLIDVRENQNIIQSENKSITPISFEVLLIQDLSSKFSGTKTFIEILEVSILEFYEQVGQHLRAYIALPPPISEKNTSENNHPEGDNLIRINVSSTKDNEVIASNEEASKKLEKPIERKPGNPLQPQDD